MRKNDPKCADEASGYLSDSFEGMGSGFSEITEVGRSQHNIVLRAKRFGRLWLLKGILPEARSGITLAMLRKELEVMMKIDAPGVVKAWSMEDVEPYGPCIAMEWVEGVTLDRWLAGGPSRADRRRMACALVGAVGRIHAAGVVHRDLKPTNIMVSALDLSPVIIDFGLADTLVHAVLKQPAGTRGYISGEQAHGSGPDIRNDIYSLGVVLAGMDCGVMYSSVASRCMKPMSQRYGDTHELLRALHRRQKLPKLLLQGLSALAIAAGVWVWMDTVRNNAQHSALEATREAALATHRADSLTQALAEVEAQGAERAEAMSRRVAQVSDSVKETTAASTSISEAMEESRAEEKRFTEALNECTSRMDRAWENGAMRYLRESAETIDYTTDYSVAELERIKARYIAEQSDRFDSAQLARMEQALDKHIDKLYNKWREKRNQMISND